MTFTLGGYCPACGHDTLMADEYDSSRTIMCANYECHEPDALAKMLGQTDQHRHLIEFGKDGMLVQHPLLERVNPMFECRLADDLHAITEAPALGLYAVEHDQTLDERFEVERDEVLFVMEEPRPPHESLGFWQAIPLGAIVGVPADTEIPDEVLGDVVWVLGQRISRKAYPELAQMIDESPNDFGNTETEVALPRVSQEEGAGQAVMRIRPHKHP